MSKSIVNRELFEELMAIYFQAGGTTQYGDAACINRCVEYPGVIWPINRDGECFDVVHTVLREVLSEDEFPSKNCESLDWEVIYPTLEELSFFSSLPEFEGGLTVDPGIAIELIGKAMAREFDRYVGRDIGRAALGLAAEFDRLVGAGQNFKS